MPVEARRDPHHVPEPSTLLAKEPRVAGGGSSGGVSERGRMGAVDRCERTAK